jgi:hypothetical protein
MVLKLWRASESPAGLIIARLLGPDPKDSDLADMPQGLGIHISSKFSGGAETAGVWTPTWEPVTRDSPSQFSCVLYIKHRYKWIKWNSERAWLPDGPVTFRRVYELLMVKFTQESNVDGKKYNKEHWALTRQGRQWADAWHCSRIITTTLPKIMLPLTVRKLRLTLG